MKIKNRRFFWLFIGLFAMLLIVLVAHLLSFSTAQAQRQTERLLMPMEASAENTAQLSPQARQITAVYHPTATVALLDADGAVLTQTQEFLLLQGDAPQIVLLPELTESERDAYRAQAQQKVAPKSDQFAAASYDDHAYEVVYLHGVPMLTTPLTLELTTTDVPDVYRAGTGEVVESAAWLPYLCRKTPDTARLLELLQGAAPQQNLLRWEHFRQQPAPEGVDAAQIAAYQLSRPLLDTLRTEAGTILIMVLMAIAGAAAGALIIDYLLHKRRT